MSSSPPFEWVIGIVGHPTTPDTAWSDEQLSALREVGFNTLQLSIAWSSRPGGEVLNLEDFEREPFQVSEWHRRIERAKTFGFRTLAHFGLPMAAPEDATTCILDPEVSVLYARRLRRFFREFPDVDEVLIYTYDQRAWLCSEFGSCPRCQGVPLHERLVPFLEGLVEAVADAKPHARLWWEPWELSAGQTFAVVERMRPQNFGLILHHTIAEVQFVSTTDLWFRNLARLAERRGIPVIGEGFFGGSGEDIHPLTHLACPRLVWQQLDALRNARGVLGIKEYYGLVPAQFSVNTAMLGAFLQAPDAALDDHLLQVASRFGEAAQDALLRAWELTALGMELFPWDASWGLRGLFERDDLASLPAVPLASWNTPSWQANRRGSYLVTDESEQHPWLREDVALRCHHAAREFQAAVLLLHAAEEAIMPFLRSDVQRQRENVELAGKRAGEFAIGMEKSLPARTAT